MVTIGHDHLGKVKWDKVNIHFMFVLLLWTRVQARIFIQTRIVRDFQFFKLQKVKFFKWKLCHSSYIHFFPINQVPSPINQVSTPKYHVFNLKCKIIVEYKTHLAMTNGVIYYFCSLTLTLSMQAKQLFNHCDQVTYICPFVVLFSEVTFKYISIQTWFVVSDTLFDYVLFLFHQIYS